ncbi:MAG: (deoxy)nucleoside triphosphate pyrophosphohydrolase [Myxococcota bacterium]
MSKDRIRVVSAAIVRNGSYLITQRSERAVLPGLWEFPGGRVEPGESDAQALKRELRHRVGVDVEVEAKLSKTEFEYTNYIVELYLYRAKIVDGDPEPCAVRAIRWVRSSDFSDFAFTPADQDSMDALLFGERTQDL